jgi:hypothetical protein
LQPCNLWIILLSYVSFSHSNLSTQLFNIYLHTFWGSWPVIRFRSTFDTTIFSGSRF